MNETQTLWNRNFTLLIIATALGAIGGVAGGFALSFLVFDETGSTFAAAVSMAVALLPRTVIPVVSAPFLDRIPRKPVLVAGDVLNGILYALAGVYLLKLEFSYPVYLLFSVLISSLGAFDELAFNSIFPKLIPSGQEEKGFSVSFMLYPLLSVVMTPLVAVIYDHIGVGWIFIFQGVFSMAAAVVESNIRIEEQFRLDGKRFSLDLWWKDTKEALDYFRRDSGMRNTYHYLAVSNGIGSGLDPLLAAFFRTAPGFSLEMYAFFSAAQFLGRTIGSGLQYKLKIPKEKKYGVCTLVYLFYDLTDAALLWLPYPMMLVNRTLAAFLGSNSAIMRNSAIQRYIPEEMRARINAAESIYICAACVVFSLLLGALGEVLDYRICFTFGGVLAAGLCLLTVVRDRKHVRRIFEEEREEKNASC